MCPTMSVNHLSINVHHHLPIKHKVLHRFKIITLSMETTISSTFGHDQSWNCTGRQSRTQSIATLVDVDVSMPATPRLRRREHSSTATHVAKRTLAGTISPTTAHARDSRHGTASSPRFSWCLVTWSPHFITETTLYQQNSISDFKMALNTAKKPGVQNVVYIQQFVYVTIYFTQN